MSDDELLEIPAPPKSPDKVAEKVRNYARDLAAAIDECLSKYVAEASYDDAKKALEGAQDAFDGLANLVDDMDTACRQIDDYAIEGMGKYYDALDRCAPNWRDEILLAHVETLA